MRIFIPKLNAKHPWFFSILSIVILIIGSVLVEFFVSQNPVMRLFDNTVYVSINSLPHNSTIDAILYPFDLWFLPWKIFFMPGFFYLIGILTFAYARIKSRSQIRQIALALLIGLIIAGISLFIDYH